MSGPDPDTLPACAVHQLVAPSATNTTGCSLNGWTIPGPAPAGDFSAGSCSASPDDGWCYVTGDATTKCPQAVSFTKDQPPHGWTALLQCVEAADITLGNTSDGGP
jgi:hypothetical protein